MMPHIQGAIFDVDDTLLSNYPDNTGVSLHESSRLEAAHIVGQRHDIAGLKAFTIEQCLEAFLNAREHTLQAAAWQMLIMAGVVEEHRAIDMAHPLLQEIIALKDQLHEVTLRQHGQAIPGAIDFVKKLAEHGLMQHLAIASTAIRRDIDIFLELSGLGPYFPDERIISRERVTHAKPHPEAFSLAFASLHLPESARPHVLAFEDDPRGIISAKAAGLLTCAITTRFSAEHLRSQAQAPDIVAASFTEFRQLFGLG